MTKLGVQMIDAVDNRHRLSFHPYNPLVWMKTGRPVNYRDIFVNTKVK